MGVIGYEGEVFFDISEPYGTTRKLMDNSRLNSLCWEGVAVLNEGFFQTYKGNLSEIILGRGTANKTIEWQ